MARQRRDARLCEVPGCTDKHYGKGMCLKHYSQEKREHIAERQRAWRLANREHLAAEKKRYSDSLPLDKVRDHHYKRTYGVSYDFVRSLLESQGFACPICRKEVKETGKGAGHLDHCHSTGAIRGVLCNECNRALWLVEKFSAPALLYLSAPPVKMGKAKAVK